MCISLLIYINNHYQGLLTDNNVTGPLILNPKMATIYLLLLLFIICLATICNGANLPVGPGYLGSPPIGTRVERPSIFSTFSYRFQCTVSGSYLVGLAFRNDPSYFLVTRVSLVREDDESNTDLLQNSGFTTVYSVQGNNYPSFWQLWYQAENGVTPSHSGRIAQGGWFDGSVGSCKCKIIHLLFYFHFIIFSEWGCIGLKTDGGIY